MTADGSGDEKIQPEGLVDYKIPPPMALLDPQEEIPVTVHTEGTESIENESMENEVDQEVPEPSDKDFEVAENEYKLDEEEDRDYGYGSCGKKFKIMYENGCVALQNASFIIKQISFKLRRELGMSFQ